MLTNSVNNKKIAKNTLILYFRMILIMGISLYTSRVILDKLGVTDYGLYNVIGGIVGMLSFLNGTLSIGTSRFLTYELGTKNKKRLQQTFSTVFYTHLILAVIIILLMESLGIWFLNNKLIIPQERLNACLWVFQLSVLTTALSITQVPYTAITIAHENMKIYAYVSIFEAIGKLLICYLLSITKHDKLISYTILITIIHFIIIFYYRYYCIRHYKESHLKMIFNNDIFRNLLSFSGWNILANLTETLKLQGFIILMNMFFTPSIVAAQAIANQVSAAMMQFVNNFRTAINPQIIKLYAAGDEKASKQLTLSTTVYCFDLVLLLGLPMIFIMKELLDLWLVEVPDYAVVFTQWIITSRIAETFNASFYTPMMAANRIKSNSIACIYIGLGQFLLLYILLKIGFNVMWVQYITLLMALTFSFIIKPYILHKEINYSQKELLLCYWSCFKVLALSITISIPTIYISGNSAIIILKAIFIMSAIIFSSFIFMSKKEKMFIINNIKKKINYSV